MLHSKKKILENLLISIVILYSIMPVVSRIISTYFTTYFYMLVLCLLFVFIMFYHKRRSVNQYVNLLFPFILWQILERGVNKGSLFTQAYGILITLIPIMIGVYVFRKKRETIKGFGLLIISAYLITLCTTIIGLIKYPGVARWLATVGSAQDKLFVFYNWKNIGGYELVYSLVLLYPLVIFAFKQKRINVIVAMVLSASVFLLLLLAEYTIAILFFVTSTLLFMMKKNLKSKDVVWIIFFSMIVLLVFEEKVSEFLVWFGGITGSEQMSVRLEVLAEGEQALKSFDDKRFLYYMRSIKAFIQNPLFGTFFKGGHLGGHSFILDTIGKGGVLGVALLVIMYKKIWRLFYKPYKNNVGYGYVVWFFVQAILLSILNPGMHLEVITFFGPILIYMIYNKE